MSKRPVITSDRLRQVLQYVPETGVFTWLVQLGNKGPIGSRAGSIGVHGYRTIRIDQRDYRSSRLAFFYMNSTWPVNLIDHRDRCRSNDTWRNLREATFSENGANIKHRSTSTRAKGAHFHKASGRFASRIMVRGVTKSLGYFDTEQEAAAAYAKSAVEHFGQFAGVDP